MKYTKENLEKLDFEESEIENRFILNISKNENVEAVYQGDEISLIIDLDSNVLSIETFSKHTDHLSALYLCKIDNLEKLNIFLGLIN